MTSTACSPAWEIRTTASSWATSHPTRRTAGSRVSWTAARRSAWRSPRPWPAPTWGQLQSRAVRRGDTWVLDGEKNSVSFLNADVFYVFVRTDPDAKRLAGHLEPS